MLFAYNPLFRAYNESGIQMLANAVLYPAGQSAPSARRSAATVEPARAAAAALPAPENLGGEWRPITIEVAAADLARTESVVDTYTDTARVSQADGSAYLLSPNPEGLAADEHPYLRDLVSDLRAAGIPLKSVVG